MSTFADIFTNDHREAKEQLREALVKAESLARDREGRLKMISVLRSEVQALAPALGIDDVPGFEHQIVSMFGVDVKYALRLVDALMDQTLRLWVRIVFLPFTVTWQLIRRGLGKA